MRTCLKAYFEAVQTVHTFRLKNNVNMRVTYILTYFLYTVYIPSIEVCFIAAPHFQIIIIIMNIYMQDKHFSKKFTAITVCPVRLITIQLDII